MKILFIFLIFPFYSYCQSEYKIATYETAADEIYADIWQAQNNIYIPFSSESTAGIHADGIICLSGIWPKKSSWQYTGLTCKPTLEEINQWKRWFEENKQKISYSNEPEQYEGFKIIIVEYEKGKIRKNNCMIRN